MPFTTGARRPFTTQTLYPGAVQTQTLAGNLTLTKRSSQFLRLDPGGSARDVTLPAAEDGLWFQVLNLADAAENLVVKDAAGNTVVTISQNERATVRCEGTTWRHMGIETIALS